MDKKIDKATNRKILHATAKIREYLGSLGVNRCGLSNTEAIKIYALKKYSEIIPEETSKNQCYLWVLNKIVLNDFSEIIIVKKSKVKRSQPAGTKRVKRIKPKVNRKEEYAIFLRTSYWRTVRSAVIFRDEKKCTKCGDTNRLHVHHLTYENHNNEHEHTEDLITLCENCHNEIHRNTHKRAVKKQKVT